ncbi:MAG TPA: RsiV family protein [Candidatus Kapabacteria bacterium]|nr:RsiV family protein [Candidatus Kapabacteria bacterium]
MIRKFEEVIRSVIIFLLLSASNAAAATTVFYSGTIGKNLPIRMLLSIEGESVSGRYFYLKTGEEITLTGTLSNGLYTLDELDSSNKVTAQFIFSRSSGSTVSGTWYSLEKKTRKLPISLAEILLYPEATPPKPMPIDFVHDSIKISNAKMKYHCEARFPQLAQTQLSSTTPNYEWDLFDNSIRHRIEWELNQTVIDFKGRYKELKETIADQNIDGFYEVTDSITNAYYPLVSILFDGQCYFMGAAHEQLFIYTRTFSFRQRRWISLGDLFKPKSNYLERLAAYCYRDIKTQLIERAKEEFKDSLSSASYQERLDDINQGYYNNSVTNGTQPTKENYECFTISPAGLTIYFNAYQVASFADGQFDVTIPFAELKDILNENGEIQEAIKR